MGLPYGKDVIPLGREWGYRVNKMPLTDDRLIFNRRKMAQKLYQVVLPWCCAGVSVDEAGMIRTAAPILGRWTGLGFERLTDWVSARGGSILPA